MDNDTPMFFILRNLHRKGWTIGSAPKQHTAESERKIGAQKHQCVARRAYIQCLTTLDTLREKGLEALQSGQPQGYYKSVLASTFPATVKVSQKSDYYKDLLMKGNVDIEDNEGNADSDSDQPVEDTQRARASAKPMCARTHGTAEPTTIHAAVSIETTHGHRTGDIAVAAIVPADQRPDVMAEDDIVGHHRAHWTPMSDAYPVTLDCHLSPGEPGHYRRLRLRCSLSACLHHALLPCMKYRTLSATANFGEREPEAYLIAWSEAATRFPTREQHMQYRPALADIRAVLQRQSMARAL